MVTIIYWAFLIFYQIFISPQGKRKMIISHKNGICKLPRDLILRILNWKSGNFMKISKLHEGIIKKVAAQKNILNMRYFTWNLKFVLNILFMTVVHSFPGKLFTLFDFSNILWEERILSVHILPCQYKKKTWIVNSFA